MTQTKQIIRETQQLNLLKEKEKFIVWLEKMGNIHQANASKMQQALDKIR
jgi:hypothetical protein